MNLKSILLLTILLTFLLINLGGYVHNTGSSLACPDWPLCHGQVMPKMVGGVLIEHTHRLLASLVGFLTLIIAFMTHKKRNVSGIGYSALAIVIIQGILGGITVIYRLPTIVSTAHLGLSMIFLCTLIYLHHSLYNKSLIVQTWTIKKYLLAALVLIYTQIIFGAFLRHLGLGAVCGIGYENSLLCFNQVLPSTIFELINMSHRFFAFITGAIIVITSISVLKSSHRQIKYLSKFSLLIVPLQILLGIMTIGSGIDPVITTLHLTGATLLLITTWKIYLLCGATSIR